ncbi:MAG: peptidase M14 [Zetaproteobacteria bacterium CG_4_9_14_3_um_filter_49_83]|nr:MAG: hypothetical protein AUJ56_08525 [Zetaproteobacteria bacterium CG1_02_49_23]PIQ33733.1 MAG: peptidase M14 [Zetaproteobacteria bacterium CG17_big_fil_post_rev_8_21_14_2_50_50_13]PIV29763.1 MAG: peptidase M14 [Zetaproteobacteria bacterium CG02_land_8_20_14_3_00_50_9]PIY54929.1 MAG: peptidase M14 [Zetaproteobacteria bacterium CG_4_10_14_0_8_um_filter_49_80]PJA35271.1 MAG: peptidase M14 [Zetaproteobacteria bacterium CG_4_9_14_3_um_filter_49_83]
MKLLQSFNHLPEGLLDCPAQKLSARLDGPALITLPGQKEAPLFISVLLHGNEDTGWDALRHWLKDNTEQPLPRTLVIFIGNIAAAKQGLRRLDGQPDYNRIWKGGDSAEASMADEVLAQLRVLKPFAAIDLHNNTGSNPHYACINRLDTPFLHLALLFSRTIIYFTQPDSVLSRAFAGFCPAITVEAGKPGEASGEEHCRKLIDAAMHLHHFPDHAPSPHDYDIFQTVAIARVAGHIEFGIEPEKSPLIFRADLDKLNFSELDKGTHLGTYTGKDLPITVSDASGREIAHHYFALHGNGLRTATPLMPSMLTLNTRIIRQDCLCYLMQRIDLAAQT